MKVGSGIGGISGNPLIALPFIPLLIPMGWRLI